MPAGDGTGPWGLGPMTGRAAGYCAGYPVPGYMNPWPRWGRGGGWGRGRGFGWRARAAWGYPYPALPYYPPVAAPAPDRSSLEQEAGFLRDRLNEVEKRIRELESEKD